MDGKISFGFNKVLKKPNINLNRAVPRDNGLKVELIKCLEGQSIQLVEEEIKEKPLVIPLKDNRKTAASLQSLKVREAVLTGVNIPTPINDETKISLNVDERHIEDGINDIEKRAARELLAELDNNMIETEMASNLVLPVNADKLPLDGAQEPTIDDYNSIPISSFGYAMLRGMGWKDESKNKTVLVEEGPVMRPKGMGLGADKALKPMPLLVPPEVNEVIEIKKGACVRILGGKYKSLYGEVEGLDEQSGRVIVKMALGAFKESFNEFMLQCVSRKEFNQFSKCINTEKYEKHKMRGINSSRGSELEINEDVVTNKKSHKSKSESCSRISVDKKHSLKKEDRCQSEESNSSESSINSRKSHKTNYSKSNRIKKKSKKNSASRISSKYSEDHSRHKKKSKKSKRGRSRSRSRGRV